MNNTKVLISYSHDSGDHKKFVLELANKLRKEGIDCRTDQYVHGFPEEGWKKWMENMIEWANFVLVICTPLYLKSCRGKSPNRGAGYEASIISQTLYDQYGHNKNKKFIAVIPDSGSEGNVPVFLKDFKTYILMKDYDDLYRLLTNRPLIVPPDFEISEKIKALDPISPPSSNEIDKNDNCPYCGLQSFKEKDEEYFFGREDFIHNQLIPAIEKKSLPFISLFGASGVGKSSVVFAGLIPRLKRENWKCVNFEPGNDPFYSLAQTLIAVINQVDLDNHGNEVNELAEELKEKTISTQLSCFN